MALVVDGAGSMHGVTHTIERIREHGVPGWEVEVIGTDSRVDRRLPAAAEVEVPFYAGISIGIPSVPELVQTLVDGRYDLDPPLARPGPAGIGAALTARIAGIPLVGSYHTELAAYAGAAQRRPEARAGDARRRSRPSTASARWCSRRAPPATSRSPGSGSSRSGSGAGPAASTSRSTTRSRRDPDAYPGEVKVLYAGRLTTEKGADLLAESFLLAHERDPRLHLLLAGGGPEEQLLRVRLGEHATFLGWLDREQLADAYASADVFLFCSRTDTYGQVIAEAQASGLPVVAVERGRPGGADPRPPDRLAVRPEPGGAGGGGRPARGLAVPARADRAGGAGRGPGTDLGGGARRSWAPVTRRRSRARAARASPRRCARSPELRAAVAFASRGAR